MKKFLLASFLALTSTSVALAGSINVFAAANTTYAFSELIKSFNELNPNTEVKVTLGSSGALNTQIQNGANADIFMAANMAFVQKAYESGFGITKPVIYARGKVAIFSLGRVDLSKGIASVESAKTISIANPKTAPYGTASVEALKNANLYDKVSKNIVWAGKISETLSQALSAADVGFIAASALYSPKMSEYKQGINYIFIDTKLYTPIDQGMTILKQAKNNNEAKAFYDFVLSDKGRKIFEKYGYDLP